MWRAHACTVAAPTIYSAPPAIYWPTYIGERADTVIRPTNCAFPVVVSHQPMRSRSGRRPVDRPSARRPRVTPGDGWIRRQRSNDRLLVRTVRDRRVDDDRSAASKVTGLLRVSRQLAGRTIGRMMWHPSATRRHCRPLVYTYRRAGERDRGDGARTCGASIEA